MIGELEYEQSPEQNFSGWLTYQQALEAMHAGNLVSRGSFKNKIRFIYHEPEETCKARTRTARLVLGEFIKYPSHYMALPYRGGLQVFSPTTDDIEAHDWYVVQEKPQETDTVAHSSHPAL